MTKNGKQQILDAAIRVMLEVGITPPRKEIDMSNARRQIHIHLDAIHTDDISLHDASYAEAYDAYTKRFGAIPAHIDLDFELCLWQEHNPVTVPARFIAQSGLYIVDAPRDTTPLSAEAWEAMHGIGQEPIEDERPIMMIRRRIVEDTAGYYGYTKFDSVRAWRLYATQNGDIWGAQWTHFKDGNAVDWQESTWGTMQHIRQFIDASAELNDVLIEWERY